MIEIKNISKSFGEHRILDDLSYKFENGKSYSIVGHSGSGKTTLLNIIGKLEKPSNGKIYIEGKNLNSIKEQHYFRDEVGYLFQNFGLIDNETIERNLQLAFVGKRITRNKQKEVMHENLMKVNLELDLNRKIYSLSGGEAQRVAIAKLMIKDPPIILADEPTASLDEKNAKEIIELILSLLDDKKIIIFATHTALVWEKVDKVISLDREEKRDGEYNR